MDTTLDLPAPSTPTKAPSTPIKNRTSAKEEELSDSPDSVMSDVEQTDDLDDGDDIPDSDREFICMNDENSRCITGQYIEKFCRKVISDHFGRNKACTRDITNWPTFCRKHYQRATYNKDLWQIRKINLIHRQFDIIEKDFPGTTYDVQLKKSEEARLNDYSRKITMGKSEAEAAAHVAPKAGKHFEAPISILLELDSGDLGKDKTITEVKQTVEKILEMITVKDTEFENTEQVPAIEFLPNIPAEFASPKKAATPKKAGPFKNPATPKKPATPKAAGTPKTPSSRKARAVKTPGSKSKTPSRVSTKGGIQKPQ